MENILLILLIILSISMIMIGIQLIKRGIRYLQTDSLPLDFKYHTSSEKARAIMVNIKFSLTF